MLDKNDITNIKILLKWIADDTRADLWDEFEYGIEGHTLDCENLRELIEKLDNSKEGTNESMEDRTLYYDEEKGINKGNDKS